MKKGMLFGLVLAGMVVFAFQRIGAASAVAMEIHHGHLVTSQGQSSKEIAKQHALEWARLRYGAKNVRLIAASDKTGYCAIAVAGRHGGGVLIGVSLANRSQAEADALAINHCRQAGGADPKVIRRWHG